MYPDIEAKNPYLGMKSSDLTKEIKELEKIMYAHARQLEFEEAAKVRDKISQAQDAELEILH